MILTSPTAVVTITPRTVIVTTSELVFAIIKIIAITIANIAWCIGAATMAVQSETTKF